MDLLDVIDGHAAVNPAKIAHRYRDNQLSYQELKIKSDALACYLIEHWGKDKTPIVVFGHKQQEMIICFLACIKAGHAYIPVDSSLPSERIKDILEGSQSNVLLANDKYQHLSGKNNCQVIDQGEIISFIDDHKGHIPDKDFRITKEDTFYIIYTSGSTGKPKGVQITLKNLESFVRWGLSLSGLNMQENSSQQEIFLNQAPFSFDLSVMDLYLALASGSILYSIDKAMIANPKELFSYFQESGITIWVSTPSFAELCLADSRFNEKLLPQLRILLFCGETLNNNCALKLYERFSKIKIFNTYGPTEATVAVTGIHVNREMCEKITPLPVGYVKDDCKILITDSEVNTLEEGKRGEIIIAGDSVSPGYYRNAAMSSRVFSKRKIAGAEKMCYRTGDEGYLKEGLLYYCGRIDFQVKLNGYRIELEDIENNLKKIDYVGNAVIIPVRNDNKILYLSAVVVLKKAIEKKDFEIGQMIKKELKQYLPEYMIPRQIILKKSLPMTVNGKINRAQLLEEFL